MKHKTMLFRSVIILFYFSKWGYLTVNEIITKGTPRVGHPVKEGLRQFFVAINATQNSDPEWVIQ
jgi:hypothetical protein